jgi:hypothetical protein
MALIKCKECGHQMSTTAKACPQCGATAPKKTGTFTKIVGGLFAIGVAGAFFGQQDAAKKPPPTQEQKAADEKLGGQLVIARLAAKDLKASMKSPDSFEIKSALLMDDGATCFKYIAVNAFNVKLAGAAVWTGSKLLVEETGGNAFVAAWNKLCAKKSGRELKSVM